VVDGDLTGLPVSEVQIRAALSWAGCIAGALAMDQYRELLSAAGFEQISLEVKQRYSAEDLLTETPNTLAELPADVFNDLVGRFTSTNITAYRPSQ
jgi:arsenite methyltransferase